MGVDLHQKVGGPNRNIIGSRNLVSFKSFKTSKVQILGFFLIFLFVLQFIILIKFNSWYDILIMIFEIWRHVIHSTKTDVTWRMV